ncbi:MAG: hypothetical protein WCO00_01415 [Rhodospirillaceae bacterium]
MTAINTGYTNYYSGPSASTSTPANFGPGQLKTDSEQTDRAQTQGQELRENERKANTGFTTPTRGSQLNITA